MLALSPRHIGTTVDFDNVQLFVDYCNGNILSGNFFSSILMPSTKIICLGMAIEVTGQDGVPVMKTFSFNEAEKQIITKLFSSNKWFALFTDKDFISKYALDGDAISTDIARQIFTTIDEAYSGELFLLGTAMLKISDAAQERYNNLVDNPPVV